jgi:hypothetical protein
VSSHSRKPPPGWRGAPEFSPESRKVTITWPSLSLRVWCNAMGLNVVAYVDRVDSNGRLVRVDIASSTWRGKPPTEEDVVLWGALVLSTWLESRIQAIGDAELTAL